MEKNIQKLFFYTFFDTPQIYLARFVKDQYEIIGKVKRIEKYKSNNFILYVLSGLVEDMLKNSN